MRAKRACPRVKKTFIVSIKQNFVITWCYEHFLKNHVLPSDWDHWHHLPKKCQTAYPLHHNLNYVQTNWNWLHRYCNIEHWKIIIKNNKKIIYGCRIVLNSTSSATTLRSQINEYAHWLKYFWKFSLLDGCFLLEPALFLMGSR